MALTEIYRHRGLQYLLALLSGALIHLSFAPYHLWPPAIAAMALFATLISLSDRSRSSMLLALLFGIGLFGAGVNWVYTSIHIYGEVPAALAFVFTAGFVLVLALLFALPWLAFPRIAKTKSRRLLCFPAAWFFSELLRGWLFTGFPWLYLGYGQIEGPLSGWIPIIGVLGAGILVATTASLLVYALDRRNLTGCLVTGAALMLLWGSGLLLKNTDWTSSDGIQIPITLVQPDIPVRDKWNPGKSNHILEVLETQSSGSWRPGLLIWPEAAIPYVGQSAQPYVEFLDQLSLQTNTAMITGLLTYDEDQRRYLNSIVGLGKAAQTYSKQRLVPFGEYLPLESWLRGTMQFFDLPMSMISPGSSNQGPLEFSYDGDQFGLAPAICYEIAYAGLVRSLAVDANMLVTLSNDAWFGASIGPWQHMQIAQARALENQKPLARATNNGISGLVNYRGELYAAASQFTQTSLSALIEPRFGSTPYSRWGDWPLAILGLLLLAATFRLTGSR